MTKREIIEHIASKGLVEELVSNVCHKRHRALPDLVQIVYEALLKYDERMLVRIHKQGALNFLIVRIIKNQYFSQTSPYYRQMRRFHRITIELKDE